MKYICPVCGSDNLDQPAYDRSPSFEICLCCGFQYGYDDDDQGYTFEQWRGEWVKEGMKWRSSSPPPKDYDPVKQLENLKLFRPAKS